MTSTFELAAILRCVLVGVLLLQTVAGCSTHNAWRIADTKDVACPTFDGKRALIEPLDKEGNLSLAFIEFTERGNVFNRGCVDLVYKAIADQVSSQSEADAVTLIVYIHGWKHNASPDDSNVQSFKKLLVRLSSNPSTVASTEDLPNAKVAADHLESVPFQYGADGGRRKIIGIYLGWRGAVSSFVHVPLIGWAEYATYWDRKSVAEEVGKGGVTEVLLSLRNLIYCGKVDGADCFKGPKKAAVTKQKQNVYLIMGHSFGAEIAISALDEVLLQRLLNAKSSAHCKPSNPQRTVERSCIRTEPFADGVVLLNPAIEASQLLQVKEYISNHRFPESQAVLMHVISSHGDSATHTFFPIGQSLGTIFWNKQSLARESYTPNSPERIVLSENDLDTKTVGNYEPFWTGLLRRQPDATEWEYTRLTRYEDETTPVLGYDGSKISNHLFAPRNSPVQMIYTSDDFIKDHNDVFNYQVLAYVSTVVDESKSVVRRLPVKAECMKVRSAQPRVPNSVDPTLTPHFDFERCFHYYLDQLKPRDGASAP